MNRSRERVIFTEFLTYREIFMFNNGYIMLSGESIEHFFIIPCIIRSIFQY
jgi:hypothetical protein